MRTPPFKTAEVLLAALILLGAGTLGSACSSDGAADPILPAPRPTTQTIVSDEVPSMEELRETGLTDAQAECFIDTIDPEGTGRVASAELFMEALGECV